MLALVGLDGFVVRAQLLDEDRDESWSGVETTKDRDLVRRWGTRRRSRSPPSQGRDRQSLTGRRCCCRRTAVALPGTGLPDGQLVGGVRQDGLGRCSRSGPEAEIARRVGAGEQSVVGAAKSFGVGWQAAMAAVWDHGRPRVDHLARRRRQWRSGWTRTTFLAAAGSQRPTLLVTGILDLDSDRAHRRAACTHARAATAWLTSSPAPAGRDHVADLAGTAPGSPTRPPRARTSSSRTSSDSASGSTTSTTIDSGPCAAAHHGKVVPSHQ